MLFRSLCIFSAYIQLLFPSISVSDSLLTHSLPIKTIFGFLFIFLYSAFRGAYFHLVLFFYLQISAHFLTCFLPFFSLFNFPNFLHTSSESTIFHFPSPASIPSLFLAFLIHITTSSRTLLLPFFILFLFSIIFFVTECLRIRP